MSVHRLHAVPVEARKMVSDTLRLELQTIVSHLAVLTYFLIHPRITCSGMAPPTMGPLTSIINQKYINKIKKLQRHIYRPVTWKQVLNCVPSLQVTLNCVDNLTCSLVT